MAADRRSMNRKAIEKFASHFDPPLQVVGTEAVGGNRVAHGWMCALHLPEHEIGLTAVCWGKGHFKAWLEATGSHDEASFAGQVMADMVDMLKRPSGPEGGESIDDQVVHSDRVSPQTDQLQALGNFEEPKSGDKIDVIEPGPSWQKQPNPDFVDMMGLDHLERATLLDHYPDLAFSIKSAKRYDADGNQNDRAGFATADQVEHVRRIIHKDNHIPVSDHTGKKLYSLEPENCVHYFKKNAVGGGFTCIRCGTDAPPTPPDAAA